MVRILIMVGVIIALIAVIVVAPRYLQEADNAPDIGSLPGCRPLAEACEAELPGGAASVDMEWIGEGASGPELRLRLRYEGDPEGHAGSVMVILKGDAMYMGEYPLPLRRGDQPGVFETTFTPPFCTTDPDMTWRAEVMAGGRSMGLPFRVLFDGHGLR